MSELQKVESPEALMEFVKRWRPLYYLFRPKPPPVNGVKGAKVFRLTEKYFEKMRSLTFDLEKTFKCYVELRGEGCHHLKADSYSCEAAHIMLPMHLLSADSFAQKFGAPSDIVLIQQNGGMGALHR